MTFNTYFIHTKKKKVLEFNSVNFYSSPPVVTLKLAKPSRASSAFLKSLSYFSTISSGDFTAGFTTVLSDFFGGSLRLTTASKDLSWALISSVLLWSRFLATWKKRCQTNFIEKTKSSKYLLDNLLITWSDFAIQINNN